MISPDAASSLEFGKVLNQVVRFSVTAEGRGQIETLSPFTDLSRIREELSLVSEAKFLIESEGDFPLEPLGEVTRVIRRGALEGSCLTPKELLTVIALLRVSRTVRNFVVRNGTEAVLLRELAESLHADKVLEFNIGHAIDPSGEVRNDASRELRSIRRSIVEAYEVLRKKLHRILREVSDSGLAQEEIITTREGRMVIPVKSEHQRKLPGFIHSASSSGATVFIEPTETLELNNEITELQFREKREIDRILSELTGQVRDSQEPLTRTAATLARIDSVQARARYSILTIGVEPEIRSEGAVRVRGGRHPLLLLSHGMDGTIPVDLDLGDAYKTLLISGPNAGGKSVTLKCIGVLTLMMQAGMHVPALSGTCLRVFRKVFVDIGDMQSIENDLSTFSSHLATLKSILTGADDQTLVLLDEIGSGTDPTEGGAIAAAVLEDLTQRGSLTIATTHHGTLKLFAHETPGIENGAMEFDQESLSPTYRFKAGVPGSSYALEMADRLSIGEKILARARELRGESRTGIERLLADLESAAQQRRADLAAIGEQKARLDEMVRLYEEKTASVSSEAKEVRAKARAEARRVVDDANALIERAVREIRESQAEKSVVREVREEVERLRDGFDREDQAGATALPGSVSVGTIVQLRSGSEPGVVDEVDESRGIAYVLFGPIRMKVALRELTLSSRGASSSPAAAHQAAVGSGRSAPKEVDVRGMSGDEAVAEVDRLLDRAVLAGLHRVDVIHGKGTGVLRKRVAQFLSDDSRVKSFRLGEWNEGGGGATIIELAD